VGINITAERDKKYSFSIEEYDKSKKGIINDSDSSDSSDSISNKRKKKKTELKITYI